MKGRVLKITVCLLLCVGVLCLSVSVYAVDEGDRIVSEEYLWAYYIYEFLHSIGIDVTYQGVIGYVDEVQDTIIDWVVNYIGDLIEADSQPSNYSIAQWIAPWQASYDYWGNLKYNSTMLEDMQDFASWLKSKLSLIDNNEIIINPVYSVNGTYTLFKYNTWYDASYVNSGGEYNGYIAMDLEPGIAWSSNMLLGYVVCGILDYYGGGYTRYVAVHIAYDVPTSSSGRAVSSYGLMNDGSKEMIGSSGLPARSAWNSTTQGLYSYSANYAFHENDSHDFYVPNGDYFEGTLNQFNDFLTNLQIQEIGDIKVVTYNVVLPIEDPDYSSGDGVTIIDGVPQYGEVTFSGVIDNLPAIVSTGVLENPEIDQIYTGIPAFLDYAQDSITFMKQIVFRMPDEVLIALSAVLSAGVIFGFLRIMREH